MRCFTWKLELVSNILWVIVGWSRDSGPPKLDHGPLTLKYSSETQTLGPQKWYYKNPIFYSFNRLCYIYYFKLHLLQNFALTVYKINSFHGKYTEAAITNYQDQRIISSYLNFSEILEKKNCERVPIYLVNLEILSLQLHKCTHFWVCLWCLLNATDNIFWWLLRIHINSELRWLMGFF